MYCSCYVFFTPININIPMKSIIFTRKTLCATICAILYVISFSQNKITGTVVDASGFPLEFANILLLDAKDSSFVRGEIAGPDGLYTFEDAENGEYLCQFSMVGYPNIYSSAFNISAKHQKIDLGITKMEESVTLEGVEIVAKRAFLEQKIDRMVVNVSNSITNAGGNALEVLTRSPGVQVNRLTKTISLVGKEGVVVMINGKLSRMPSDAVVQMLEGMNADNIDRIELIHTPPANFDAEGNAGIINIVLKSSGDEGLNGSYAVNAGRGRGNKYGGSFNFNLRKNLVNFYGGYDHNYNLNPQVFTNFRRVKQGNDILETATTSRRPYTPTTVQNAKIGLDIQLSKKTVLGVLGTIFDRNWYMEAVNTVSYTRNVQIVSNLQMPNTEINKNRSYTGNINIEHTFGKGQTLTIDFDKVRFEMNNPSNYEINKSDNNNNFVPQYELKLTKKTPIDVFVTKADYLFKLWNINFETGVKYATLKFDNDIKVDSIPAGKTPVNLSEYTSLAHMDENISAAYLSFSFKAFKNTDIKAGIRYEYTNTELGTAQQPKLIDRHYGSWFPSIYITQKINDNQILNVSFSRRIFRPQLSQLAPFLVFTDPSTLLGGNPALQPSFTNAYKLDYSIKSIRLGVSYNTEDFPISFIPTVEASSNKQINGFKNLDSSKGANAYLYVPLHPTSWWDMTNTVNVNWSEIKFTLDGSNLAVGNVNYGLNSNNTFKLPKGLTLELTGAYNAPSYFGVARWRATSNVNIGIQKDFGNKWGKLRFNVSDIFLGSNWYGITNQPEYNLYVDVSFQFTERTFMLSWTNTFGSQKMKSSRNRQTGSAEEMRRM